MYIRWIISSLTGSGYLIRSTQSALPAYSPLCQRFYSNNSRLYPSYRLLYALFTSCLLSRYIREDLEWSSGGGFGVQSWTRLRKCHEESRIIINEYISNHTLAWAKTFTPCPFAPTSLCCSSYLRPHTNSVSMDAGMDMGAVYSESAP